MSRVGKKPVSIPSGVSVSFAGRSLSLKGAKGELSLAIPGAIEVQHDQVASQIVVRRPNDERQTRALHGLTRALIANMVVGVTKGYERRLEIHGVGYNAKVEGKLLLLNVGYSGSHSRGKKAQVELPIPEGLTVEVTQPTNPAHIRVYGLDKQLVGHFTATVRKVRPPEPYLQKGIRYAGEEVRKKQGKAFAGGGA
jgi:large subunit ribosomal protein L6